MKDSNTCEHHEFSAQVNVARIEDKGGFYADVTINCIECGTPFRFLGVKGGLSPNEPRCDPFALELRAPIMPGPLATPIQHSTFEMMPDRRVDVIVDGEQ